MSLQMIHGAYKPVYMWSKFFLRTNGRTNGLTKVFHEALADLKKINFKGETSFWKERRITSCEHTSLVNSYVKTLESRWKICHRNLIKGYSKSAINIFGKFVQLLQKEKYSQEKRGILKNNLLMKDIKHLWCSKISILSFLLHENIIDWNYQ